MENERLHRDSFSYLPGLRSVSLLAICLFAALHIPPSAFAQKPLAQKLLGDVSRRPPSFPPASIAYRGIAIKFDQDENFLAATGKDKKARPWTVYIPPPAEILLGTVWAMDNPSTGEVQNLIFILHISPNGRCTTHAQIVIISFDAEGRPLPWDSESNPDYEYDGEKDTGQGLFDLGDWNSNGRAELVEVECLAYEYQDAEDTAFGLSGIYESTRQGYWQRLSASDLKGREALYRRIASRGARALYPRPKDLGNFQPDYSNDPAHGQKSRPVATVASTDNQEHCGLLWDSEVLNGQLVIKPPKQRESAREQCFSHFLTEDGVQCYGSPGIVMNTPTETIAELNGGSTRATALLNRIIQAQIPVTLTGQTEEGHCSPNLIWATLP